GAPPALCLLVGNLDRLLDLRFVLAEEPNSLVHDGRPHRNISMNLARGTAITVGVDTALEIELAKRLQGCFGTIRAHPGRHENFSVGLLLGLRGHASGAADGDKDVVVRLLPA